jgi:plastocyanin
MAGLAAILVAVGVPARVEAADHLVEIQNFTFIPANLEIEVGDSVTWTNRDSVGHTATCNIAPDPRCGSSPLLFQGGASFTFTYETEGTFAYHCQPHPQMTGTIEVNAPDLPPAEPPQLGGVTVEDGQLRFMIETTAGRTNVIEASSNFMTWEGVHTNVPSTDLFEFTVPANGGFRVYRVRVE